MLSTTEAVNSAHLAQSRTDRMFTYIEKFCQKIILDTHGNTGIDRKSIFDMKLEYYVRIVDTIGKPPEFGKNRNYSSKRILFNVLTYSFTTK